MFESWNSPFFGVYITCTDFMVKGFKSQDFRLFYLIIIWALSTPRDWFTFAFIFCRRWDLTHLASISMLTFHFLGLCEDGLFFSLGLCPFSFIICTIASIPWNEQHEIWNWSFLFSLFTLIFYLCLNECSNFIFVVIFI